MFRLYAAVGHGIKPDGTFDPGAVGGGQSEQWAGDIVVAAEVTYLKTHYTGIEIKSEAYSNDPNYPGTTSRANSWPASAVVSVHHDWIKAPTGFFCHWTSAQSKVLADDIYNAVAADGGEMRPLWHKERDDLYLLNHTNMPAVIVECGRIGQYTEKQLQAIGVSIAKGIAKYAMLKPIATTPPPTTGALPVYETLDNPPAPLTPGGLLPDNLIGSGHFSLTTGHTGWPIPAGTPGDVFFDRADSAGRRVTLRCKQVGADHYFEMDGMDKTWYGWVKYQGQKV